MSTVATTPLIVSIRRVLGEIGLWERLAIAARNRVEQEFTWPKVVERCLRSYGIPELSA